MPADLVSQLSGGKALYCVHCVIQNPTVEAEYNILFMPATAVLVGAHHQLKGYK